MVLSGNRLYGTTLGGGTNGHGVVFSLNADGSDFSTLYSFSGGTDGASPNAGLLLAGGKLYGTTSRRGLPMGNGTIFCVDTSGSGFTVLYSFTPSTPAVVMVDPATVVTNMDGASPPGCLMLSDGRLYGTTSLGGTNGGANFW
jgi:uncharacterized repeat protein (TIGR03803 family)